ncbi:alkaline phosphatase (plasmid) [Haloplanus rallus]|uniref:Alkaline phosphatase n=1 Tax=Haloplanus rallus TaxID=1816183 RepID=A0A6B9F2J3_9EURY|nr:alkaline phosphatase [Haloplanus rallus]QGX93442.1 alkaline phosphatase [Haloplanus rallus]
MKFKTEALTDLVEAEDPVNSVWQAVWNIWAPPGDDIGSHYSREPQMVEYERLLLDVYSEFYTDILTDKCVNEASMNVPEDGTLIMMDSMSVREASLFVQFLQSGDSDLSVGYSYSTVPSETMPFRERVGYSDLKKEYKTASVKSQEPSLDGDERIVWCRFPDALLENIQEGKTKLSSIEEMYEKSETALRNIIAQLDTDTLVITSDHGYARLDSGHTFQISDRQKNRLQDTFSGRFESVGEVNADDLVEEGLVVEADGYYMPLGRYTWPAGGKYSNFQHGGLSVSECITPRITVNL